MTSSYSIITDGKESHRLEFTKRDWGLLRGPYFEAGQRFISVLGVYDHFTVAAGIPKGAKVTRQRLQLLGAAQQLLAIIQRDEDLLQHDYKFSFSGRIGRPRAGAESGFRVRGFIGNLDTRPHGYCFLNLVEVSSNGMGRIAEYLDMRIRGTLETDDMGTLKIHRQKAEMRWPEILPPLIEFVRTRTVKHLDIEHYD